MSTVEAPASHLPLPMQNILSRLAANSTEAEQALVRKAYALSLIHILPPAFKEMRKIGISGLLLKRST